MSIEKVLTGLFVQSGTVKFHLQITYRTYRFLTGLGQNKAKKSIHNQPYVVHIPSNDQPFVAWYSKFNFTSDLSKVDQRKRTDIIKIASLSVVKFTLDFPVVFRFFILL